MSAPSPATPLPWGIEWFQFPAGPARWSDNGTYAVHAANAFPHLVAALEALTHLEHGSTSRIIIENALAIARGEATP